MAGSKTNAFETSIAGLIFQNTDIANIGDTAGLQNSVGDGSLFIGLYTTDPTETGAAGAEATFGSYARQAVSRTGAAGWTIAGPLTDNTALITFPEATSGSETITHITIMTAVTAGDPLYHSTLNTSRLVNTGTTLEFAIGALTITED